MKKETNNKIVKISDFYTASPAEQGSEMIVTLPGDDKSKHTLLIRGADSVVFRRARSAAATMNAQLASQEGKMDKEEFADQKEANICWWLAHCIKEWPFEDELTILNAQELLINAPAIQDQLNDFAGDRANFLEVNLKKPPTKS